jgi:formylglycine-generating enzyme required for sulfatase activity
MGSPASEANRDDDEVQHEVTISKPFYMGVTQVTQAQWEAVMGTEPWKGEQYAKADPDHAVNYVSWNDCQEFIRKLNAKVRGRGFRLPTEAEWEYACRAGSRTQFHFGDDESKLGQYAWYHGNAYDKGEEYPHAVAQKQANAWGLYDMHGNVWEWCEDWYGEYPRGRVTDPTGPANGKYRVVRGGGWFVFPSFCRAAFRYWFSPDYRFFYFGLRVAWCSGRGLPE